MPRQNEHEQLESSNFSTTDASLRRIANLLALLVVKDRPQNQQIVVLNNAGIPPREIAALLGTTKNNVNVRLSEHRARKKAKGKER